MSIQQDEPQVPETQTATLGDGEEAVEQEAVNPDSDGESPDLAPDQDQKAKVTFDEGQQAVFNQAIEKKVHKQREAERETERLRIELEETKAKIPQESRPAIPDLPDDPFADDYKQQIVARDTAIADAAAFDAREGEAKRLADHQQQEVQKTQVAQLQQVVGEYTKRAGTLGISDAELKAASDVVNMHGISNDLTAHILMDEKGPAITKHLAENPLLIDEVRGMNPMQAAVFIETKVKPSISGKSSTAAPDPATTLNGGGSPPGERGPKGSTFT